MSVCVRVCACVCVCVRVCACDLHASPYLAISVTFPLCCSHRFLLPLTPSSPFTRRKRPLSSAPGLPRDKSHCLFLHYHQAFCCLSFSLPFTSVSCCFCCCSCSTPSSLCLLAAQMQCKMGRGITVCWLVGWFVGVLFCLLIGSVAAGLGVAFLSRHARRHS